MQNNEGRIAVVGAGMGGLAAAGALLKAGFDVQVYEQAGAFARVGAGIQMNPNAVMALRGVGLDAPLREISFEPLAHTVREGASGAVKWRRPMSEAEYGAPYLCLHRADLHRVLDSIVPDERIHLGSELTAIRQDGSGATLEFADGRTATADAVIGADGLRSVVRDHVVKTELTPERNGRVAYRAVFPADRLDRDLGDDRTFWTLGDRGIVIYYTTRAKSEVYLVTSLPEAEDAVTRTSWSAPGDVDELRAWYDGFHPDVQAVVGAVSECHMWPTADLPPLETWSSGRVALLGDAAHPMTPRMASGAAMAIEDAMILARCLSEAGTDLEGAFARYEGHRKARTSLVQALANQSGAAGAIGNRDMTWLYGYDAWAADLSTAPAQPDIAALV